MFDAVTEGIRKWLISLFANAINAVSRAEDRVAAVQWLSQSRDIVASDQTTAEKFKNLNSLVSSRAVAITVAKNVGHAVQNYRNSNLSWPMKIALPATLAAIPLVGGHGAGIAAFGTAVGVPVLLLIFLGAAGITSIIETVVNSPNSRADFAAIVDQILHDEVCRRANNDMKAAMRGQPTAPQRKWMPPDEIIQRERLLTMDPFEFERHVMSFFEGAGLQAWATPKSKDKGIDGVAIHPDGIIAVQCKRNSAANKVGSPEIQQFWGAISQKNAYLGYIVTTSTFTKAALDSSVILDRIILIDMDRLIQWHSGQPNFN